MKVDIIIQFTEACIIQVSKEELEISDIPKAASIHVEHQYNFKEQVPYHNHKAQLPVTL